MNAEITDAEETSIAEYNPVAAGLAELERKYANVVVDVTTTKALDEAKRVRSEIRVPRYETEKIRKMLKAPALAHAKLIDTEAARITARLIAIETPWDEAIKAEEARKEAEEAEADRIERARVEAIVLRIADIRECAVLASQCRTAAEVLDMIDKLTGCNPLEGFEEFSDEAATVRDTAIDRMRDIHAAKLADEAEAARAKAEREAETQRLADERAQLAKERAEQAAAHAEANRKALAEAAAAQLALNARRAEQEAELQRQRDAIAAEQEAAQALIQAELMMIAKQREQMKRDQEALRQAEEAAAVRAIVAETDPIFNQEDGGDILDGLRVTHEDLDGPSDGEIIAVAVTAVAAAFACTPDAAINRLAEIQEWIVAEVDN